MQFEYAYKGSSAAFHGESRTELSFSPDVKREPTYFSGELRKGIEFREAISALHDVVVSDLRFKPKDKTAYKAWVAKQDLVDWDSIARQRAGVANQMKGLREELAALDKRRDQRMGPFYKARQRYFDYLWQKDRDAWYVLDPVITVHPDEVFFECFSQDESSYGRLGASYKVFQNIGTFACGTTNIDYSAALYDEFQKIRSYKSTKFGVDPSGFDVKTTGEEEFNEVKIDLPDSWVRGFLQVNSAMALPAVTVDLHPMDVHNFCFVLRRRRERKGPRSMRWHLTPDAPVRVVFEPWNIEVVCPQSIYRGKERHEIRVWGRRRVLILERLVPIAKRFTVHLVGQGMPSFYVADLGDMSFTLGLSGWTANDWATAGNFDLMAPRAEVDEFTKRRVFDALKSKWVDTPDALAEHLALPRAAVLGALGAFTQAGRAIYDLNKRVYRARELTRDPLPMDKLRFSSEREESATLLVAANTVQIKSSKREADGMLAVEGAVKHRSQTYEAKLFIDADARLTRAECTCNFFRQNKLFKGPCEHMLAVRIQHTRPRA